MDEFNESVCHAQGREAVLVNSVPPGVSNWFAQNGCVGNPQNPLVFCCPCGTGLPPQEVRGEDHMVGALVATNGNGQQVIASGGPEGVANCPTVPAANGNGQPVHSTGMTIYPAGMVIGAGVSAGLGFLVAGALGYGGKNGALLGGLASLAGSLYINKKNTGTFIPSSGQPHVNTPAPGVAGCGCGR